MKSGCDVESSTTIGMFNYMSLGIEGRFPKSSSEPSFSMNTCFVSRISIIKAQALCFYLQCWCHDSDAVHLC